LAAEDAVGKGALVMVERTIVKIEDDRTGLDIETLKRAIQDNLYYIQGKFPEIATLHDWYMALAYTVRDRMLQRWISTVQSISKAETRTVCYFSAEYLLGPHLLNNLLNLDLYDNIRTAVEELGFKLDHLIDQEEEPGLGNGGLGRLAACYLDSLATLEIPAIGYGIRYEFGIFDQIIKDGWQMEITDKWLRYGNPWEIARPEAARAVKLGGRTEAYQDDNGRYRVRWVADRVINGVPYDTPITGYKNNTANTLRLWKAEAPETFNFQAFNAGDYFGAVQNKMISENISKVLYPNDDLMQGRLLRLEQQYFFVSCSLQDIIHLHQRRGGKIETLHQSFAMQLNDTHPSVAVAELMRLLIDEHDMDWDKAWTITQRIFGYTNHTLLPEALEKWPVDLFGSLLPRHLEIIYEINRRFLDVVRTSFPDDEGIVGRLSLIDESGSRFVRMAHLASVGSHAINGVAELHSELLKADVLKDFYKLWPAKFFNVTNGVTPRRWIGVANPELTSLITETIGDGWLKNLDMLHKLEPMANDANFKRRWHEIKRLKKTQLAEYIHSDLNVTISPDSIFDVQVKRMHEYKRQHLNVLHIITLYNRLKRNRDLDMVPRTFMFGGKAAPGYFMAKMIIKLINSVADVVNHDKDVRDRLKIVFLPDYNVTLGQRVYPAADLSEQISTAGKEASGTGNMKFALNGALTVGTLDGANVEIRDAVGPDNFFLFGLTAEQVVELKGRGYKPHSYYETDEELRLAIDQISNGTFSHGDRSLFAPLVNNLLYSDPFMLLADYRSYINSQNDVSNVWRDTERWTKMSILNVARMGRFSSDRSINDYCQRIWDAKPVPVELLGYATEYCQL
jgi:glycogen phosphorylase